MGIAGYVSVWHSFIVLVFTVFRYIQAYENKYPTHLKMAM
jgi:hypothetical protein